MLKTILLLTVPSIVFLLLIFMPQAFAQYEDPETQIEVKNTIGDFFEGVGDFAEANTNSSEWFDQAKKDNINEVTQSGVKTGKTAFDLWFSFHQLVVDAIFAGSPIPFDRGIIVLISFVIGTLLVFKLFWAFIKKIWKIVLVLIALIAIVIIAPIEFPSLA